MFEPKNHTNQLINQTKNELYALVHQKTFNYSHKNQSVQSNKIYS